ncbi:hypothetical protein [Lysinibacillus sp. LZ02]|uniref:hypothetical protein n=1 Tax=Lysinibacillus sp. LZ02 TaxID=3420668 RepID=UPI003D36CB74
MNEQFIVRQLILNGINYHKFGDEHFKQAFHQWMWRLHHLKGFATIDETCAYFEAKGQEQECERAS